MTIDTKELRKRLFYRVDLTLEVQTIEELLDRLEEAEKAWKISDQTVYDLTEKVIPNIQEKLGAAEKELAEIRHGAAVANDTIKALRTKITEMERQELVEWQSRTRPVWNDGMWTQWSKCSEGYAKDIMKASLVNDWIYEARPLYALPGAQGEEK